MRILSSKKISFEIFLVFRQEKLLGQLSEKDSQIADLEMDRSSSGASNRSTLIEKFNNEKQQIYNQLKELVSLSFVHFSIVRSMFSRRKFVRKSFRIIWHRKKNTNNEKNLSPMHHS